MYYMTQEKIFELQDLVKQLDKEENYFIDFLKIRHLEAGIIVLHPGEEDIQEPHSADELYCVIEGSGLIELDKSKKPVKRGSIIFVPAGLRHKFCGNKEDLVVLYMFAE
jgi:mannose-6-phosphate isomerase-like protein (cupin superfamily)